MTSTDLLYSDPLAAATKAAAEIAQRTGVAAHDVWPLRGLGMGYATAESRAPVREPGSAFSRVSTGLVPVFTS